MSRWIHLSVQTRIQSETIGVRFSQLIQSRISDFFSKLNGGDRHGAGRTAMVGSNGPPIPSISTGSTQGRGLAPVGTSHKESGFNFCNRNKNICRYCIVLHKSGQITCSVITSNVYNCMSKVSCRSSNLIQYVGQTLLREGSLGTLWMWRREIKQK